MGPINCAPNPDMETYTDRLFCSGRTVNSRVNLELMPEFSLFVELRGGGSDLGSGGGRKKALLISELFFCFSSKNSKTSNMVR